MTVEPKQVKNRRSVRFETYDDLLKDVETLASGPVKKLGNWDLAQSLDHLAKAFEGSIDGLGFKLPFPVRWVFTLLKKKEFVYGKIPPGFKTGKAFDPPAVQLEDALPKFRDAVARLQREKQRTTHPAFGDIPTEEWDQFNLRHAELHMSFLVAESATATVDAAPAMA